MGESKPKTDFDPSGSEEKLRKSEDRYYRMIDEVEDYAIILLDENGLIQNWNKGAQKIKGYNETEIIGKHFSIFYLPEDQAINLPGLLLSKAANEGRAIHEGWRLRKDGSRFWGSITLTALHGDHNEVIGYSKVTRDLTERKQAEDKLKEYLLELQKQNEELDRFAYAASHDLQEPLRKIQTFADMLEQNLHDEATAKKYLAKINTASERMSHLIRSILEFSRLSKDAPVKELTNLNEILKNVLSDQELSIHEKQARIESGKLPTINAIQLQMHQLFTNLISNSLKYSNGQPLIKINASFIDSSEIPGAGLIPGTGFHHLSFTDNGIGFEPQYAEKIFAMFQRLHGKHEYSGTGIGLALCKKIMDNHGGYIHAESRPGEGATFHVYFKKDA